MKAYVFPGQGAQFTGMGKDLFDNSELAKSLFKQANDSLGFEITRIMFEGEKEELTQTKVTQPAIFLHSVILAKVLTSQFKADMVAGHSLAMQKACEKNPSTMAAILGLEDKIVEEICQNINGVVVPANYNCPGQLVISGSNEAIEEACQKLTDFGAKRALKLSVGGAFHSPLMEPAQIELAAAIESTPFKEGDCPIYQNVTAKAETNAEEIKSNLIKQLTASVKWTQTMQQMLEDGLTSVTEVGPGKVLQGLFKKMDRTLETKSAQIL